MAVEFVIEQRIAAPPERVFAVATDLDGASAWMEGLVKIERVDGGGPFGVGTRWRETRVMMKHEATEEFEVTACEAPRRIELYVDGKKGSSKRGEYRFRYDLTPAPGGSTDLRFTGGIGGMGLIGGLFARLFKGMFKKACAKDLAAMCRHAEAATSATS